eukprot:TRINITY_DN2254_c0_g1_i1.p1 TRINITY_DN2254_c0_g1~~TRINITY_DN2254_c0_g1_i1.p1  ORF type:complete len:313 (+),score=110.67 TRINITY_DN2254_c0_g1_i1:100-1038(+)
MSSAASTSASPSSSSSSASSSASASFDVTKASVSELLAFMKEHSIKTDNCIDKSDLLTRIEKHLSEQKKKDASSSTSSSSSSSAKTTKEPESKASAKKVPSLTYRTLAVGPLSCNCAIVMDEETKTAMIIDPGGDADKIIQVLKEMQVKSVQQILLTHAHFDHVLAVDTLKKYTKAPVLLHQDDLLLWKALPKQAYSFIRMKVAALPDPDRFISHGDKLNFLDGVVIHTPGHSPGSCSFYFPSQSLLFSGDTLFHESVGRTDFAGGDSDLLTASIQKRLYTLPENTKVIPGHGDATTIGYEKTHNSVVRAKM